MFGLNFVFFRKDSKKKISSFSYSDHPFITLSVKFFFIFTCRDESFVEEKKVIIYYNYHFEIFYNL